VEGIAPGGERVRLQRSRWQVFELSRVFRNLFSARVNIGRIVDSAYLLLTAEQRENVQLNYSSDMVTDIRYDSADGQYRIRIYSPLTENKPVNSRSGYISTDLQNALYDESVDSRMQLPPSSGFLVSIQKVSHSGSIDGTADNTDTFMAISIKGEDDPELNFKTLAQLIGSISKSIKQQLGIAPSRVVSKIRTGASLTVESDSTSSRDNELLFAAYDSNTAEHDVGGCLRADGSVDVDAVWRSRSGMDFAGQSVPAEVEFNAKNSLFHNPKKPISPERFAALVSAAIQEDL
jgi:hypothetical protein